MGRPALHLRQGHEGRVALKRDIGQGIVGVLPLDGFLKVWLL